MKVLDFEELKDNPLSEEQLKEVIAANKEGFILRWMVSGAQTYSDVVDNYLEAAFIGQECLN
nr:hypothetical protein [Pedobacter sp. ASV19]